MSHRRSPLPGIPAAILLVVLPGSAGSARLSAQEPPSGPGQPPGRVAPRRAYPIIATIRIVRQDVFDLDNPDERHPPYILADRLHIETREEVIRRELLFKEGDPADPDVLYESERNLRRFNFLHDNSRIETVKRADGRVDVLVHTRDVWTTRPSISFKREGNRTTDRFSFLEDNLLGRGKRAAIVFNKELDRNSGGVDYSDPRLLGTWWTLDASYFSRSDGLLYLFDAERPFYSLHTRNAGGGGGTHFSQVTTLQLGGEDAPGFRQHHTDLDLHYGRALRTGYDTVHRLIGRFRVDDDLFDPEPGEAPLSPLPPVGGSGHVALPDDRRFRVLEAEYQSAGVRFTRVSYLDRFDRYQDINLGNDWAISLGVSPVALGDDHDHVFVSGRFARWFHLSPNTYTQGEVMTAGRYLAGVGQDVVTQADFRHYYVGLPRQTLVAHAGQRWGHNLDGDHQFLLGAESGLRGYDSRRFDGNKRLLLNAEDRAYLVFDWLHLVSVAFAGFADAGYAWRAGESEDLGDIVGDVGVGLRFDVTRGGGGTVIRLDYAYPVNSLGQRENPRGLLSFTAGQAF